MAVVEEDAFVEAVVRFVRCLLMAEGERLEDFVFIEWIARQFDFLFFAGRRSRCSDGDGFFVGWVWW